jgi:hypothetical protein
MHSPMLHVKISKRNKTSLPQETMATHNIVVFAGDHCGPEVGYPGAIE